MNKFLKISSIILSIAAIFFSLYEINHQAWIWDVNELLYQQILGVAAGIAAFTGVISIIKFYQRKKIAFTYATIHGILYGAFALSINLTGDFLVNIFWFVPIKIYFHTKLTKNELIYKRRLNTYNTSFFILLFSLSFIFFFFANPYLNNVWNEIVNIDEKYGDNFKFILAGNILNSMINSLSIVALTMMIMGIKESWYIWIIKNILAIIFFSYVGVFNVSIVIMNVLYLILTIEIIFNKIWNHEIKVAIVGPGAVGKTTIINLLTNFLVKNNFKIIAERDDIINDNIYDDYMLDMKKNAFKMQKKFFETRLNQYENGLLEKRMFMDRHLIDDFIFPIAHIERENFNKKQTKEWQIKLEPFYWNYLNKIPKLDFLFIILADDKIIEKRRIKRSKQLEHRKYEILNNDFFVEVNKLYYQKKSILYKAAKKFVKKTYIFENIDSKITANKIKDIIEEKLKKYF